MKPTLSKIITLLFLTLLATFTLFGQAAQESPYDVNSPTTKAPTEWYETPFLWIGLVIFLLAGILLYLRKGKTPTKGSLHKY